MAQIQTKNLNLGGIADSDYLGNENSASEIVNCDIHSESGVIKANQKLSREAEGVVDELILASVSCSNGSSYHFGDDGGIYERTSAGSWSKRATANPSSGSRKILSAEEYNGYIYYAMEKRLGRIQVPSEGGSWSGRNDSWKSFANGDDTFHPMKKVNIVLYIGDKNLVAQVDDGVFSEDALDIQDPLRISALGKISTDLLIGTFVGNNVMNAQILRWNTYGVSYSVADEIPEVGINAFLETDNTVIINAGLKGNLYVYNGVQMDLYKQVKGDWGNTTQAKVNQDAVLNLNGKPLFGLSQVSGTGVNLGVYSLARTNRNYPYVLNLEHTLSTNNLTNVQVGSMCAIGSDQFVVSWVDTNGSSAEYGVDVLDLTEKATAYFVTRNTLVDRENQSNYKHAYVAYRTKPENTEINIYTSRQHEAFSATKDKSVMDSDRLIEKLESEIGNANVCKIKVEIVPDGNNTPEIEMLIFDVE